MLGDKLRKILLQFPGVRRRDRLKDILEEEFPKDWIYGARDIILTSIESFLFGYPYSDIGRSLKSHLGVISQFLEII